jgi:hypothetical protein
MEESRPPPPNEPPDDKLWKLRLNLEMVSHQSRPSAWITISITLLVLLGFLLVQIPFREIVALLKLWPS